jgi:hypothetical protein
MISGMATDIQGRLTGVLGAFSLTSTGSGMRIVSLLWPKGSGSSWGKMTDIL